MTGVWIGLGIVLATGLIWSAAAITESYRKLSGARRGHRGRASVLEALPGGFADWPLSAAARLLNVVVRLLPTVLTAEIIPTEIPVAIRPYRWLSRRPHCTPGYPEGLHVRSVRAALPRES
jgi:hypothetical protein